MASITTMIRGHLILPLEDGLNYNALGSFLHPEKVTQLHWSTTSFMSSEEEVSTAKIWATWLPSNCQVSFATKICEICSSCVCRSTVVHVPKHGSSAKWQVGPRHGFDRHKSVCSRRRVVHADKTGRLLDRPCP
jgi:hypothetical protein